jgi:hypothetical protein
MTNPESNISPEIISALQNYRELVRSTLKTSRQSIVSLIMDDYRGVHDKELFTRALAIELMERSV